jgi:hypothetical protein
VPKASDGDACMKARKLLLASVLATGVFSCEISVVILSNYINFAVIIVNCITSNYKRKLNIGYE